MMQGLVIDRHDGLLWAVVVDGKTATDIYAEPSDVPDLTGAIVHAKVTRTMVGQNAAIVRWGAEQEGYWSDAKNARAGEWVTLQVKSGAYADKLPQLSSDIALAGRFLIHLPKGKSVKQSRRAGDAIALPAGLKGGWIVRRHAAQATPEQLHAEADFLARQAATLHEPAEQDSIFLLRPTWQRAIIDHGAALQFIEVPNAATERMVLAWLQDFAPDCVALVRRGIGAVDFDALRENTMASSIALPEGSRLTIEQTRAFWACDVDAGPQQNHLQANILAGRELARHMRLRNMGGMIVVDFITLRTPAEKQKLLMAMREAVVNDPAGVEIFGLTKLGLLEMTRQRRGISLLTLFKT
jgi:ribonuclease E/ribonuclease G